MNHLAGARDGQTPLTPDEVAGLIPSWISTQGDLDRAEQDNISAAFTRLTARSPAMDEVLTEAFLRSLHSLMFGDVWSWAGKYRGSNKNLGVPKERIVEEVAKLLADVRFWIKHSIYPPDEIAVRFHHKLVWIHPFVNGNGRTARTAADLLVASLGGAPFSWREADAASPDELRIAYIAALRTLDANPADASDLVAFARA